MEKLIEIQSKLKAPKSQTNSFGKYKYRSCEDILEALKPLLLEQSMSLTITDEMVEVGGRVYVKATATLRKVGIEETISVSAFAREAEVKKGMDDSQITGSASSYARKYALNGLFLIDDTKDADTRDNREEEIVYISSAQQNQLVDTALEVGADMDKFMEYLGVDDLEKLSVKNFKKAMVALEKKGGAK